MNEIRMSLADAATLLGIAPNSVRSRFKAGNIRGERDNLGKIWVWLNPALKGPKRSSPKSSTKGGYRPISKDQNKEHLETLEPHVRTLLGQLVDLAQAELVVLRARDSRAEAKIAELETLLDEVCADRDQQLRELVSLRARVLRADHLEAEMAGLEALRDEIRIDRDHWRDVAELEALREEVSADRDYWRDLAEHLRAEQQAEPEVRMSLWSRLIGRS